MRNPGSAGLTTDRLGDADPWVPEEKLNNENSIRHASGSVDGIEVHETK
jgi:hypothetical protein